MSQLPQSMHDHIGKEAQGIPLVPIQRYLSIPLTYCWPISSPTKHRTHRCPPRSPSNGCPRHNLQDHALEHQEKPISVSLLLSLRPAKTTRHMQPTQGQSFKTSRVGPFQLIHRTKHKKLYKMRRQRNTLQTTEQGKNPGKKLNETVKQST